MQDYIMYTSDGTPAGTDSANFVVNFSNPFVYKGYLYYSAGASQSLWRSNGTVGGTQEVVNFINLSQPQAFTVYNDRLYFKGTTPGFNAFQLWSTDGVKTQTHIFPATSTSPLHWTKEFYEYNGGLYFSAGYDNSGYTLWKLDPFPTAIQTVEDDAGIRIYPNPAVDNVRLAMPVEKGAQAVKVVLYNIAGQEMAELYNGLPATNLELSLPAVSSGLYNVRVTSGTQTLLQQPVLISQ